MVIIALLLQAAPAAQPAPAAPAAAPVTRVAGAAPDRFSILIRECPGPTGTDVVVCGANDPAAQRLPYPDQIVPDHGVPSNPYRTGTGALAAESTPCAARLEGCQVGVGPPLVPMIAAAVRGVQTATANHREAKARARDGDRRQPIDLAGTAPAGRIEP